MTESTRSDQMMQAIVIGGPAHGVLLKSMRADAEVIQLRRPEYVKPLEHSKQEEVAAEYELGTYDVCTLWLAGDEENPDPIPFGLAIERGRSVAWAMSQLVRGFVQHTITEMQSENLIQ